MLRVTFFSLLFSLASVPAFAHEGAGLVHFLTQSDHIAALIVAIAVPGLFWLVLRRKQPAPQKRSIEKTLRKD